MTKKHLRCPPRIAHHPVHPPQHPVGSRSQAGQHPGALGTLSSSATAGDPRAVWMLVSKSNQLGKKIGTKSQLVILYILLLYHLVPLTWSGKAIFFLHDIGRSVSEHSPWESITFDSVDGLIWRLHENFASGNLWNYFVLLGVMATTHEMSLRPKQFRDLLANAGGFGNLSIRRVEFLMAVLYESEISVLQ